VDSKRLYASLFIAYGSLPGWKEERAMQGWHATYLGLRVIPRELSECELQAFFTFDSTERAVIQRRRGPAVRLGLALHIGFVRMSGRPLEAFRVLPVVLLRPLGKELGIPVPDIASLRALYRRRRTLFEHQQLTCRVLGFGGMTEHQRRALLRMLKDEVFRSAADGPEAAAGAKPPVLPAHQQGMRSPTGKRHSSAPARRTPARRTPARRTRRFQHPPAWLLIGTYGRGTVAERRRSRSSSWRSGASFCRRACERHGALGEHWAASSVGPSTMTLGLDSRVGAPISSTTTAMPSPGRGLSPLQPAPRALMSLRRPGVCRP
jgi:hypothetical protein